MTKQRPENPTACDMRLWNYYGNKPKYTKKEHESANPNAEEMRRWNEYGNEPKYTKKEYQVTNPTACDMRLWNSDGNKPKCTKEEHQSKNPNAYEMRWWNKDGNEPKYTDKEIRGLPTAQKPKAKKEVEVQQSNQTYNNIVEWLYLNDGVFSTKGEWRKEFLEKLKSELNN